MVTMHRFWAGKNIDVSFTLLIIWAVVLVAISFQDSLQVSFSWVIDCFIVIRDWIYVYETLATGILAVMVGFATIWTMNYHSRKTQRWRDEDKKNRFKAMQTKFLLDLVDITHYNRASVRLAFKMASLKDLKEEDGVLPFSERVIDNFCQLIYLADGAFQNRLVKLFQLYQKQNSRMNTALESYDKKRAYLRHANLRPEELQKELDETAKYDGFVTSSCLLLIEANTLFDVLRGEQKFESLDDPHREAQLDLWMMSLKINKDDWPETLKRFKNHYPKILGSYLK